MKNSPLARALATIRGNPDARDALASSNALARAGVDDRPAFADGGYCTTDAGDAPSARPWSASDGGPFKPSPNDAPQHTPHDLLTAIMRAHGIEPNSPNLAHALGVIGGQRPAFADGGGMDLSEAYGGAPGSFTPSTNTAAAPRQSDDGPATLPAFASAAPHAAMGDNGAYGGLSASLPASPSPMPAQAALPALGGSYGGLDGFVMPSALHPAQASEPEQPAGGFGAFGGFADGGAIDPLAGRPHFEYGGSSDRGYSGSGDSSSSSSGNSSSNNNGSYSSSGSGGYGGGVGGFGFGGGSLSSSGNSASNNSGSYSSSGNGNSDHSSFNSGSAAGSSTGGYGGFGGYSNSASVGGSYNGQGGSGSYSSSGVSSSGSSNANGGYGSVSGSLGQNAGNSYGGTMNSGGSNGSTNGGFGSLGSSTGSYSGASAANGGFGNFSSSTIGGLGVGATNSEVANAMRTAGYSQASIDAANTERNAVYGNGLTTGAESTSQNSNAGFGSFSAAMGLGEPGSYSGYGGSSTSSGPVSSPGYAGSQDGYGTNVATMASQSAASPFGALAGVTAPAATDAHLSQPASQTPGFAGFGQQQASASQPGFGEFGTGPQSEAAADAGTGRYGVDGYHPDASLSVSALGGYGTTAQTPSDAFSAGVKTGAAMAAGAAGPGLAASGPVGTTTAPLSLSPSIQAAMMSRPATGDRAQAFAGLTQGRPGGDTGPAISAPGMGYDSSQSTAASTAPATVDGTHALTIGRTPVAGMASAAAIDSAHGTYDAPGAVPASTTMGVTPAEQAAYDASHEALAAKTQKMATGIDGAGMFSGQVGQFLGAEAPAVKNWLSNPQAHPEVAAAMNARLGQLQHEVDTNNVGGVFSVDRHGLDSMMSEGGYSNEADAINAARGFITGKMADVAPTAHAITTGDPAVGVQYHGDATSAPSGYAMNGSAVSPSSLSPSIASAAGMTGGFVGGLSGEDYGVGGGYGALPAGFAAPSITASQYAGRASEASLGAISHLGSDATATGPIGDPASVDGVHAVTVHALGAVPQGAPVGMRNNNLGNIGYGKYAAAHGAVDSDAVDVDHTIAHFANQEDGIRAAASLAASKYAKGMTTANSLIAGKGGWTPGALGPGAAVNVSASMGIGPNEDMHLDQPERMNAFLTGLAAQEHGVAGKNYYTSSAIANALNGGQGAPSQTVEPSMSADAAGWSSGAASGADALAAGYAPSALNAGWSPGAASAMDPASPAAVAGQPAATTATAPAAQADLSTGQKIAKTAINAGIGFVPGVGPVLAAGNAISGLLGYGTLGEYLARNASPAKVGSPAMAGADHSSGTNGFAPSYGANGEFQPGSGYGALDPSVTGSSGVKAVDPNAAARTALDAMGGSTSGLSPAIAAAANGNVASGTPNAVTSSGVQWYDPMKDPMVLAAFARLRVA